MGNAPSTQDDLLRLKTEGVSSKRRQQAFQRLRNHFTSTPTALERLRAAEGVEVQRFQELWPRPPAGASRLEPRELADRIRGCLFGAALGDAAGLATEFLTRAQVEDFYGHGTDFIPGRDVFPDEHRMMWCPGDWTDDTDQHVLLMQSLLNCGGRADPRDFAARLASWRTSGFPELGDESGAGLGQTTKAVLNDPRFLEEPHAVAAAHSASIPSNGGVMRTAAAGIPSFWDEADVATCATSMCKVTHANACCVASCVAVALCISRLLQGADVFGETDADCAAGALLEQAVLEPSLAVARASLVAEGGAGSCEEFDAHCAITDLEALKLDETGKIGYTLKCLGSGLWALRSETGFRETMNELLAEAGDADTNGAVAGALLGCRLGYSALPQDWIAAMPYSAWLEAYAQKVLFMLGLRS